MLSELVSWSVELWPSDVSPSLLPLPPSTLLSLPFSQVSPDMTRSSGSPKLELTPHFLFFLLLHAPHSLVSHSPSFDHLDSLLSPTSSPLQRPSTLSEGWKSALGGAITCGILLGVIEGSSCFFSLFLGRLLRIRAQADLCSPSLTFPSPS